jgi:TrmH family RNA methyltransferase
VLDRGTPIITSMNNSVVKRTRSLLRRKGRYEERAFLVEGARCVFDAFAAGCPVEIVLLRADAASRELQDRLPAAVPVRYVDAGVFDTVSDVAHAQGIMATVSMDSLPRVRRDRDEMAPLVLIVDGVRDPGNLGTLLRSAAGGGASEVLLTPRTVDPFNPKCVRAAMGAHFRIPLLICSEEEFAERTQALSTIALADAEGTTIYSDVDWTGACAVVVGGEAEGASIATRSRATITVRIPLTAGVESLNAGVAGSLLIFEAARQRRHA